ncbi:MAG: glycosyltransferase family 9 protein [Candidatus Melainabacteria bacterium]|jgi:heptosyltransferase I|nr:glycosyltransferase family 9 protein [Candidatus Melainabacteria bacterium]
MNILIVKLSAIGDVVHCLPLAAKLKEVFAGCRLSWLVEPAAADLLRDNGCVDEVIEFSKKRWLDGIKDPARIISILGAIKKYVSLLRGRHFDLAIDAQGLLKSGLLTWASGAPVRIGLSTAREGASLFYTDKLDSIGYRDNKMHVVDWNLALGKLAAQKFGKGWEISPVRFPLPRPTDDSLTRVGALLSGAGGGSTAPDLMMEGSGAKAPWSEGQAPLIVVIPGTTWSTKIWPQESWASLCRDLLKRYKAHLVIVGGPKEAEDNARLVQSIYSMSSGDIKEGTAGRVSDLTGKTGLIDLIALFGKAEAVIGLDTGPMHLAVAVQRPLVAAIHGASPWHRNGPYGHLGKAIHLDLDCQPCFDKHCRLKTIACLKDLSAGKVFQELIEFWDPVLIR